MRDAPAADVHLVHDLAEVREVVALLAAVWGGDPANPPMRVELVQAIAHSGGYVAAASAGSTMVGASVAWLGLQDGRLVAHSHITGLAPAHQGRGVGAALKAHQRTWAAEHGVEAITWTFDPLVRRNAWFNLAKLGARLVSYHPDFYGRIDDGVNHGEETDRVMVWWDATPSPAPATTIDAAVLRAAGAVELMRVGERGEPIPPAPVTTDGTDATTALVHVPDDIVALRRADPDLARAWRLAIRGALGGALAGGWSVMGISRDGWYALHRDARA